MDLLENSIIFPRGDPTPAEFAPYFSGRCYLNMLTGFDCTVPIGNVTFEPGCRNHWHSHPGGQILLVTGGRGWYQEDGKPAQTLHAGDVINIPPRVKHWHGAAKGSWFVHLAVETDAAKGGANWMEPVSEEAYSKLP